MLQDLIECTVYWPFRSGIAACQTAKMHNRQTSCVFTPTLAFKDNEFLKFLFNWRKLTGSPLAIRLIIQ